MVAQVSASEAWSLIESNPGMREKEWETVLSRMPTIEKRKLISALIIGERNRGCTHPRKDISFNTLHSFGFKEERFASYLSKNLEPEINSFNTVTKNEGLTIDDIKDVDDEQGS